MVVSGGPTLVGARRICGRRRLWDHTSRDPRQSRRPLVDGPVLGAGRHRQRTRHREAPIHPMVLGRNWLIPRGLHNLADRNERALMVPAGLTATGSRHLASADCPGYVVLLHVPEDGARGRTSSCFRPTRPSVTTEICGAQPMMWTIRVSLALFELDTLRVRGVCSQLLPETKWWWNP